MRRMRAPLNGSQLKAWRRGGYLLVQLALAWTSIASLLGPAHVAWAQPQSQITNAQALLAKMTPEERVGQLFLVTFRGTNTGSDSQIYDLIVNHHVGGVILLSENDNFLASPDTVTAAHQLISQLQSIEMEPQPAPPTNNETPVAETPTPSPEGQVIPLFIGISQEGDGAPNDQILSGLTPLPDEMAIGATWKTELARQVGSVLGHELSALGFNLFLGPSLDVVDMPNPSTQIDLGTRSFGGHPFWVGQMGQAYISGLHTGSEGRMMVVAKHFPGRGSADRSPEEEVATVRKPVEQLMEIELFPFVAATNSGDPASNADGLLVSHIRYQGFQGNIRSTTRPVSLDTSALATIIQLPEFASWRANGGLIVSDTLGSQALRDFYSQGGENFSARLVARDAFLAGNDLLYLGDIASEDQELDTYTSTLNILEFFTQEYKNDPAFAELVNDAVIRILAQKLRMYDTFSTADVLPPESGLMGIGASQQVTFDVARSSATLISPDEQELGTLLPAPPNQNDRIIFITDTVSYQQCSSCPPQTAMATDALKETVERLYGPAGSAQIFANRLTNYPLSELELMLNGESKENIEPSLERANWIVISLVDVRSGQIELLRRFFSERPNLVRNKNVILFSFTAPYYLDATDISKLTAYYALYSKQPAFIEIAARLLFQQIALQGASPVSTVGYDLTTATSPDPTQVIPLALDEGNNDALTPTAQATPLTVVPTAVPLYKIGDTIPVRAGPIYDHNHHIVPDGTPVQFMMSTSDETGQSLQQINAVTTDGIARASFAIDKPGNVEINVVSEPAVLSEVLQIPASNEGAAVTVVAPLITVTPIPPTATATLPPESDLISREGHPRIGAWLLVLLTLFGGALLGYWAVSRIFSPRWGLRWALCIFIGGLLSYNYLALGFPGAAEWIANDGGAFGVLVLTFIGEIVGILAALLWMRWPNEPTSRAN